MKTSGHQISLDSHEIADKVSHMKQFQDALCIFAYMDVRGEVMTKELIKKAWDEGKQVAVPKVSGKKMEFYYITDFAQCTPGCFDIPEPETGRPKATGDQTFMIVPGVAFDRQRHRIGYGGGYYDRYLDRNPGCTTAAVAFSWQVTEYVPHEPFDIVPDYLVTEKEII